MREYDRLDLIMESIIFGTLLIQLFDNLLLLAVGSIVHFARRVLLGLTLSIFEWVVL